MKRWDVPRPASHCRMDDLRNFPLLVFVASFLTLWFSAQIGVFLHKRSRPLGQEEYSDLGTVVAATLTLLGLFIAFSFSMAISRYDQRKNYEADEANAIGTEYVRAGLLRQDEALGTRRLLNAYLQERILFYEERGVRNDLLEKIEADTARVEGELWAAVTGAAARDPTPTIALVVSGMNDMLNARSYTQASWWNRIPVAAWTLMGVIAIFCNFLIGYSAHRNRALLLIVLPLAVSISFSLVADIDSPRGGGIRILPHNLISLSQSLKK